MLDGRVYFSTDNWATVYEVAKPGGRPRKLEGEEADLARYIAFNAK
jgi:hypothetical protein